MLGVPWRHKVISRAAPADLSRQFWPPTSGLGTFPWVRYHTVIDIGAAEGGVPVQLALRHPHLTGGGFDLPAAGPILTGYVIAHGLAGRLRFYPGDFFADPLPPADVLIFGHILHDWSPQEKLALLRKAHDALPDGGAVIIYDAIIDNDRRASTFGLLMSVNMLIETPADAGYTAADSLARRCRLPRQLRQAARRTRLHGRRHQVAQDRGPVPVRRDGAAQREGAGNRAGHLGPTGLQDPVGAPAPG